MFPSTWPFEGLDARQAYSPLLRPGVLLGFDGLRAFESSAVAVLAAPDVRAAVARIAAAVERIRAWRPDLGRVPDWIRLAFDQAACVPAIHRASDPRPTLADSISPGSAQPPLLPAFAATFPESEPRSDLALRRYLAARLVGGWVMFQADDRSQFRGWIFSIARNALFDFGRQRMKVGREGAAWGDEIEQVVDGKVETPLVWLEKIESNNQFKRCLDELDSENRDIVKARSSNESYESICKRFKLSTGAAHSRIHRITERLKNCVEGKEKGFDRHMEGESR